MGPPTGGMMEGLLVSNSPSLEIFWIRPWFPACSSAVFQKVNEQRCILKQRHSQFYPNNLRIPRCVVFRYERAESSLGSEVGTRRAQVTNAAQAENMQKKM